VDCLWDDPGDPDGNVHHVLNRHPEMKSTQFIEKIFSTFSGDEDACTSRKNRFEIEKTYAGHLYRFVFIMEGSAIRVITALPIAKRRSKKP
jgi:hypothetical protein